MNAAEEMFYEQKAKKKAKKNHLKFWKASFLEVLQGKNPLRKNQNIILCSYIFRLIENLYGKSISEASKQSIIRKIFYHIDRN